MQIRIVYVTKSLVLESGDTATANTASGHNPEVVPRTSRPQNLLRNIFLRSWP